MTRNVITKNGVRVEPDKGVALDYQDACDLLNSPAWKRYFVRKLMARKEELARELETLDSCDIIEFKKRQAQIFLIGEIIRIPEVDEKNLRR